MDDGTPNIRFQISYIIWRTADRPPFSLYFVGKCKILKIFYSGNITVSLRWLLFRWVHCGSFRRHITPAPGGFIAGQMHLTWLKLSLIEYRVRLSLGTKWKSTMILTARSVSGLEPCLRGQGWRGATWEKWAVLTKSAISVLLSSEASR